MSVANELPACIQYNMWCEKKNYIRWKKTVENEEIERKRRRRFAEKGLIPLHFSYILPLARCPFNWFKKYKSERNIKHEKMLRKVSSK